MQRDYYNPTMFATWPQVHSCGLATDLAKGEKQVRRLSAPSAPVIVFEVCDSHGVFAEVTYDCAKLCWTSNSPYDNAIAKCAPIAAIERTQVSVNDDETVVVERTHHKIPALAEHIAAIEKHLAANAVYVPTSTSYDFEPESAGLPCTPKLLNDPIFRETVGDFDYTSITRAVYYERMVCINNPGAQRYTGIDAWKVISMFTGTKHVVNVAWNPTSNVICADSTFRKHKPLSTWRAGVKLFDQHIATLMQSD